MTHPSVEELLAGGDAAREHLDTCPACRRVIALADDPSAPRVPAPRDDFPADVIDRVRYTDWTALGDGGGGMGHLFRAFDARLGREVVIKQPRGSELRARFEREALTTARLQHPAIVAVYEAGRFGDGAPFYAMPLVRGAPLSDEIARCTTPEARLALLPHVAAVCEAVAYAHEQGIVHRDLKPANVLVGSFGETVVIDWGLATDLRAPDSARVVAALDAVGDGLTQLGVGTPHYMPPEQARGAAADLRMDVYALGATLYHALAGTPPYGAIATEQVRSRVLVAPPAPLAEVAPSTAPALCDIVARAMAREPAERFATARELAEELRRFQTGRLVQSRRYSPAEILRHFARRYRAPLLVAAVAATLLAGVGIVSTVRVTRAGNAAQAARLRAEANERASRIELHRGMGVAASRLALSPTRRPEALALAVRAVAPAVAAGETPVDAARQALHDALAGPAAIALDGHGAALEAFAFSPDGAHLVARSPRDHSVHLWDGRSGAYRGTVAAGGGQFAVEELAFSPDGARLLTWARTPPQAQLWELAAGGQPRTLDHDGHLAGAAFFSDGSVVLAGRGLTFVDAAGTPPRHIALDAPAVLVAGARDRIAVAIATGVVDIYDVFARHVAQIAAHAVVAIALSPDGAQLAILDGDGLVLHDVSGARPPRRIASVGRVPARSNTTLRFASGGQFLVVERGDDVPALVVDVTGVVPATEVDLGVTAVDDAGLWSARPGRVELYDVEALAPVRVLEGPPGIAATALAIGPAHRIAVATESGAWLVDATARDASTLVGHSSEVTGLVEVGRHLISSGLDGRVLAWDETNARTGTARLATEAVALDGVASRAVVGGLDGSAHLVDTHANGAVQTTSLAGSGTAIVAATLSRDGRWLAAARTDGELFVIDLASSAKTVVRLRDVGAQPTADLVFSLDGAALAAIDLVGRIELWDTARAVVTATYTVPPVDDVDRAHWTLRLAGSSRLLASRFGGDTTSLALPGLADVAELEGRVIAVSGARVVTVRADGDLVVHDAGTAGKRIASTPRPPTAAVLSADGALLAIGDADGVVRVHDLAASGGAPLELRTSGDSGAVTALHLSADGRRLTVGYASGALRRHHGRPIDAFGQACASLVRLERLEPACATVTGK